MKRCSLLAFILLLVLLLGASPGRAQLDELEGFGGDDDDEFTLDDEDTTDYQLLKWSHLSEVDGWQGKLQPLRRKKGDAKTGYTWRICSERGYSHLKSLCARARLTVAPISGKALKTFVDVPKAGSYRIWLCYLARSGAAHPVHLTVGDGKLTYNKRGIDSLEMGKIQEKRRPIRFESEFERGGFPKQETFLWEYRDVKLKAGRLTLQLTTRPGKVRVDAVFITMSKSFQPSKAMDYRDNTLGRTYFRFRVAEAQRVGKVTFSDSITYHWRHAVYRAKEPLWYSYLEHHIKGSASHAGPDGAPLKKGQWSRWADGTSAVLSPGPYLTCGLSNRGASGKLRYEAQMAWFPHDSAVVKTLSVPVAPKHSRGTMLLPLHRQRAPSPAYDPKNPETKVWGMRPGWWLKRFRNALDVAREHMAVVAGLGLGKGPLASRLRFTTGCGADPVAREETGKMLRRMGLSHVGGLSKADLGKLGMRQEVTIANNDLMFHLKTHCPTDPLIGRNARQHFGNTVRALKKRGWEHTDVKICKLGDEIGAIRPAGHINNCSDCRKRFLE